MDRDKFGDLRVSFRRRSVSGGVLVLAYTDGSVPETSSFHYGIIG